MKQIETLLANTKSRVCICIDGRCGAGKSTLAYKLAQTYDGAIVHMDHFFLPANLRSENRVNVHYERFLEEAAPYLRIQKTFSYRVFDCKTMMFSRETKIEDNRLIIVEGAYCMLPQLANLYHYKIFADIGKHEQRQRIIERNGVDAYKVFEEKWIPIEEAYFEKYSVKERCDYYIKEGYNVL